MNWLHELVFRLKAETPKYFARMSRYGIVGGSVGTAGKGFMVMLAGLFPDVAFWNLDMVFVPLVCTGFTTGFVARLIMKEGDYQKLQELKSKLDTP
jgi:hypothetical protein